MSPYVFPGVEDEIIHRINAHVSRDYGVGITKMKSPCRKRETKEARHVASYLLYMCTEMTYEDIGVVFGDRDHTTIIHSVKKTKKLAGTDYNLNEYIKNCIVDLGLTYSKMKDSSLTV